MYEKHFGLTDDPFRVTPDRRFLFVGDVHGPVISKLRSAMARPHGLCHLNGAPGVGKTLVLRQVAGMLPDDTPVSFIYIAPLDFRGFLSAVLTDFGVEPREEASADELLAELGTFVAECRGAGRRPVVIVDEAGNLAPGVAGRLQELARFQHDGDQGLALVLACDLAHRDGLLHRLGPDVVDTELTIDPLGHDQVADYIGHRLRAAGWRDGALFYEAALERIAEASAGVPRLINMLAGKALLLTHLGGGQIVSRASVDEAARELWSVAKVPPAMPAGSPVLAAKLQSRKSATDTAKAPARERDQGQPSELPEQMADSAPTRAPDARQPQPAKRARAGRGRRYALLTAFALAAALFTVKMSTEGGQRDVIETAEPVIENVGKVADGLRDIVAAADREPQARRAHVDWTPPPRPVPVLTRSAQYAKLQDSAGASSDAAGAGAATGNSQARPAGPVQAAASLPPELPVASPDIDRRLRVRELMKNAAEHIAARRYTEPAGANALAAYSEVLTLAPGHEGARRGMRAIALRLERRGRAAEERGDWDSATEYYRQALAIDSASPGLRSALQRSLIAAGRVSDR